MTSKNTFTFYCRLHVVVGGVVVAYVVVVLLARALVVSGYLLFFKLCYTLVEN